MELLRSAKLQNNLKIIRKIDLLHKSSFQDKNLEITDAMAVIGKKIKQQAKHSYQIVQKYDELLTQVATLKKEAVRRDKREARLRRDKQRLEAELRALKGEDWTFEEEKSVESEEESARVGMQENILGLVQRKLEQNIKDFNQRLTKTKQVDNWAQVETTLGLEKKSADEEQSEAALQLWVAKMKQKKPLSSSESSKVSQRVHFENQELDVQPYFSTPLNEAPQAEVEIAQLLRGKLEDSPMKKGMTVLDGANYRISVTPDLADLSNLSN